MPDTRESLILRIVEVGDPHTWKEFFVTYHPYVKNIIRRYRFNEHDACDAEQEAFVALLRALPRFVYRANRGRFRGWLKTVVQHVAIDLIRRRRRSMEIGMAMEAFSAPAHGPAGSVDEECDDGDSRKILHHALQQVRSRSARATWSCFEEHFLNQRTAADVGAQLGLNSGAVYMNSSRIHGRVCACASQTLKKK